MRGYCGADQTRSTFQNMAAIESGHCNLLFAINRRRQFTFPRWMERFSRFHSTAIEASGLWGLTASRAGIADPLQSFVDRGDRFVRCRAVEGIRLGYLARLSNGAGIGVVPHVSVVRALADGVAF